MHLITVMVCGMLLASGRTSYHYISTRCGYLGTLQVGWKRQSQPQFFPCLMEMEKVNTLTLFGLCQFIHPHLDQMYLLLKIHFWFLYSLYSYSLFNQEYLAMFQSCRQVMHKEHSSKSLLGPNHQWFASRFTSVGIKHETP